MPDKYKYLWRIFAILFLAETIILATLCSRAPEREIIDHYYSDTIHGDSVPYEVAVNVPVPVYIDTGKDVFWTPVDTAEILREYFARVIYLDTLKDDSSAFIAILDTVTHNRLLSRRLFYANRKPTVVNNYYTTQSQERYALHAGAMVAMMPDRITTGPVIMLTTPKGLSYSYAIGVNSKTHVFTFTYKLRLLKRKVPPD